MAIERVINIVANAKQAAKEIKDLFNTMLEAEIQNQKLNAVAEETGDVYKESSKDAVKSVEKIGDSAEKQGKIMQKLNGAVKAVGTSLKALGIGLVIALVAKFTEVLSNNQKVVDAVSTVSTTLSIVINQLFNAFSSIASKINEATGGFNALGEVVGSLVKIAFNNLKITILQLQAGFSALKLAYEKVFGDDEGVEKAKKDLTEIKNKLTDTLKDQVKQGKNIISNVGEAVDEVVTGVSILAKDGTKAISDIDLKSAYAQAQAITRNKKNFELLALQQQRLQLQYQAQAEVLRQVRDDDRKSITERIKANDQLSAILKKQFQAESATIQQRINALQQEQSLLGVTAERTNEIYQLQTDLIDVNERLTGQESEQLANKNALLREQQDLLQTISDNENQRRINELNFKAEQATSEQDRLNAERERIMLERELALEDLENKRLLYAEGTQARVDAEQEYLNKKQELDFALIENNKATFAEIDRLDKESKDKQKAREEALKQAKVDLAGQTLQLISEVAGEGSKIAKGVAIAQATISGIEGVQNAFTTANKNPITAVFPAYPYVQAGLAGAFSLLQIKKIASTDPSGAGSSSGVGGSSGASVPQAPSFNLIEGTGSNQIAESLATERRPVQAYVVASNVSSAQELDRNAINEASL